MSTPQTLEEVKTAYTSEKAKFIGAVSTVAGSRWLTAIASALALSFGVTLAYAPDRFPHLSGISLTTFGLPDNLDFGVVGEQAVEAGTAAVNQGAEAEAASFLAEHLDWIPALNAAALGITLAVLLANMWVMTKRRRVTRG